MPLELIIPSQMRRCLDVLISASTEKIDFLAIWEFRAMQDTTKSNKQPADSNYVGTQLREFIKDAKFLAQQQFKVMTQHELQLQDWLSFWVDEIQRTVPPPVHACLSLFRFSVLTSHTNFLSCWMQMKYNWKGKNNECDLSSSLCFTNGIV